jgi:hypothetical protein
LSSFINHIKKISFLSVQRLFHKEKPSNLNALEVQEEASCR